MSKLSFMEVKEETVNSRPMTVEEYMELTQSKPKLDRLTMAIVIFVIVAGMNFLALPAFAEAYWYVSETGEVWIERLADINFIVAVYASLAALGCVLMKLVLLAVETMPKNGK